MEQLLLQVLSGAAIVLTAALIPRLLAANRWLKQRFSSSAIDIVQAILIAYALIYCVLLPVFQFVSNFGLLMYR